MKLKELIERIKRLDEPYLKQEFVLELVKQLDEPEKVKVPQFVADWIENSKQEKRNLRNALNNGSEKMRLWLLDQENYDLFARAWLDGYEVEKEKRYLVKMKGIDTNFNFLNRYRNENYWIFSSKDKNTLYQTHHTRKELEEADFGWVFDCPGIEIEEVE
jgi:uncharacterized protein YyaL (SSP411 family)